MCLRQLWETGRDNHRKTVLLLIFIIIIIIIITIIITRNKAAKQHKIKYVRKMQ